MKIPVAYLEAPVLMDVQEVDGKVLFTFTDGTIKSVSLSQLRAGHNIPSNSDTMPPGKSNQGPRINFDYPKFGVAIPYSQVGTFRVDFTARDDSGGKIVSMSYQIDTNAPINVSIAPTSIKQMSIPIPNLAPGSHIFSVVIVDNQGQELKEFVRWLQEGVQDIDSNSNSNTSNCTCPTDPVIVANKQVYKRNDQLILQVTKGRGNTPVILNSLVGNWSSGTIAATLDQTGEVQINTRIPIDASIGKHAFKVEYADSIVRLLEFNVEL